MGANMQRRAVPRLNRGLLSVRDLQERTVAVDPDGRCRRGGMVDLCRRGVLWFVNDNETTAGEAGVDIYNPPSTPVPTKTPYEPAPRR